MSIIQFYFNLMQISVIVQFNNEPRAVLQVNSYHIDQRSQSQSMKKTKSASIIHTQPSHWGHYKKSVQLQPIPQRSLWPRLSLAKSVANLHAHAHPHDPTHSTHIGTKIAYNEQQTSDTASTANYQPTNCQRTYSTSIRPSTILKDKLTTLHAQIEKLQKQIAQSRQNGKNKSKDYQQQLKKYDEIVKAIHQTQNIVEYQAGRVKQIQCTIGMLHEDCLSKQVNLEHNLAEKQYCEEVLDQYTRQYQSEAMHVLSMLEKQSQNVQTRYTIQQMQNQLKHKQKSLADWKSQISYDLQQKMIKNKITQLRIDLMKYQQQANKYADQFKVLKIREILCVHIKQYLGENKMVVSSDELNEEGMEIYVCRQDLCEQFQQAVINYRGKDRAKYDVDVVQRYFNILAKIQAQINNPKYKLDRKINKQYTDEIALLRKSIFTHEESIKKIQHKYRNLIFANESVAIIEHLRESTGRYELTQIKTKLKAIKEQQKIRINKIKDIHKSYVYLKNKCYDFSHVDFMNQLTDMNDKKKKQVNMLRSLENKINTLKEEKNKLENYISMAVSKWSQVSFKKDELKKLYKDLNQLNKQIRQAQVATLNEKSMRTTIKERQPMLISKKSQILANCMRETMKLRINGAFNKNKQNQNKLINLNSNASSHVKFTSKKPSLILNQQCKTRKPSLSGLKSARNKNQLTNKSARDSLTAVLMSKFGA